MEAGLAPTTAASRDQPVAAAMAWPAVMVSQETRLSLPSRCSTMTRIVSDIMSLGSQFSACRDSRPRLSSRAKARRQLQHPQFVTQLVDQFLCNLGWRALDVLGLFCLLRNVEALDFLQIRPDRRLHFGQPHFP